MMRRSRAFTGAMVLLAVLALSACTSAPSPSEGGGTPPSTGTRTTVIEVRPWVTARYATQSPDLSETLTGSSCLRGAYRSDSIECDAGAHCYLGASAKQALCPMDTGGLTSWKLLNIDGSVPQSSEKIMDVLALRLTDGEWCFFSDGAGPTPPNGYAGGIANCGTSNVLWSGLPHKLASTALGQDYFAHPGTDGYLRVAVGPAASEINTVAATPSFLDVAAVYY